MVRALLVAVVALALGAVACAGAGQQPQTAKRAQPTRIEPVTGGRDSNPGNVVQRRGK